MARQKKSRPFDANPETAGGDRKRVVAATPSTPRRWSALVASSLVTLAMTLSAPTLAFWPFSFVALTPLAWLLIRRNPSTATEAKLGRIGWAIYLPAVVYWLIQLQGLRHAHPWMFLGWFALSAYLAAYLPLWFWLTGRLDDNLSAAGARLPLGICAASVWLSLEWCRNTFLGGLSAGMLGHHVADVPLLIQIADLFGSYGVSTVLVLTSFSVASVLGWLWDRRRMRRPRLPTWDPVVGVLALSLTIAYGFWHHESVGTLDGSAAADTTSGQAGVARVMLVGLNQPTVYGQSAQRDAEIFDQYALGTLDALEQQTAPVDLVVWPESMFGGGSFVALAPPGAGLPDAFPGTLDDLRSDVAMRNQFVRDRAQSLQRAAAPRNAGKRPAWWGGMGVVKYAEQPRQYSATVVLDSGGSFLGWYGKRYRVMFGEYIPFIQSIPIIKQWVPPELGLSAGYRAEPFQIAGRALLPNICIETAVERIAVNDVGRLLNQGQPVDAVITIANDDWFDGTAVVDHHRRCAQLLAVAIRRPILSSANGGPTFCVDDHGRIGGLLGRGEQGGLVAPVTAASKTSLYVRTGTVPHTILTLATLAMALRPRRRKVA